MKNMDYTKKILTCIRDKDHATLRIAAHYSMQTVSSLIRTAALSKAKTIIAIELKRRTRK